MPFHFFSPSQLSPRIVPAKHSFLSWLVSVGMLAAILVFPTQSWSQDDDDDDFFPGVNARYTVGSRTITRVDQEINFLWEAAAADSRLPAGPFTAVWTTTILIRQPGRYRLHAHAVGKVAISLDGKPVLSGRRRTAGWISSREISLGFGEKPLKVTFHKTEPTARLRLFWSSNRFPLEPLPIHQLFREGGKLGLETNRSREAGIHRSSLQPLSSANQRSRGSGGPGAHASSWQPQPTVAGEKNS